MRRLPAISGSLGMGGERPQKEGVIRSDFSLIAFHRAYSAPPEFSPLPVAKLVRPAKMLPPVAKSVSPAIVQEPLALLPAATFWGEPTVEQIEAALSRSSKPRRKAARGKS